MGREAPHVAYVATKGQELALFAQRDSGIAHGSGRVAGQDADVGACQQTPLVEGLMGQPADPDLAPPCRGEVLADRRDVLVGHDRERHGDELGLGDGLPPSGLLADRRRVVDELPRLQVAVSAVVVPHHAADVVHDGLDDHRPLVVAVLVEELVAQQRGQGPPGEAAGAAEVALLGLHRRSPFFAFASAGSSRS